MANVIFRTRSQPAYLSTSAAGWQRRLYEHPPFRDVIETPSFDAILKTPNHWSVTGDHRAEIAGAIESIALHYGLGAALRVLQAQQLNAHHILTEITVDGHLIRLADGPSAHLPPGQRGEHIIFVPLRQFRGDVDRLASLNIMKPRRLWHPGRVVSHEADGTSCCYCSAPETNPIEVIGRINGAEYGLDRDYRFGFTPSPFGNPVSSVHCLIWDAACHPLSMSGSPSSISDLAALTREINAPVRSSSGGQPQGDRWPALSGLWNSWAGNTCFHHHVQFWAPEFSSPITNPALELRESIWVLGACSIRRLKWPLPVYKIDAPSAVEAGRTGNAMLAAWQQLSDDEVPYKDFPATWQARSSDLVAAHTVNIYVPGERGGKTIYFVPRDRRRVHFTPGEGDRLSGGRRPQPKRNAGVLEVTGTLLVDDFDLFREMQEAGWSSEDVSGQFEVMGARLAPDPVSVKRFEDRLSELH